MTKDARIDAYIEQAPPFAQPILTHLRALVHTALPAAEETIKWSMPHFTVGGKNVAGMAAFKAHCAFVVHGEGRTGDAMGQHGKITKLTDLPDDAELTASLQRALERVAAKGTAAPKAPKPKAAKTDIAMPDDFATALAGAGEAHARFEAFAPSHRREYLEWITEAKRPETRAKRIAEATGWIAEGKKRNWKYGNC
ncbi:YdeI/OmpD-associated family protein [Novosphingobium lentum]|uniref:YdeI/OmpD-associated family protein n=1 Tax=Novosphingobium lentum TaxID=145287 RepID=UPI0008364452|nr:YdeI/OmpD-associated family protein [Novosphingobium lentum]